VVQRIVEASGYFSFAGAAFARKVAGLSIRPRHVPPLAQVIGGELAAARDAQAVANRRRQLPPEGEALAADIVAVVEVDGGRLRTRPRRSGRQPVLRPCA